MPNQSPSQRGAPQDPRSTVADRISMIVTRLRSSNSTLGFVLSEMDLVERTGKVMDAIVGENGDRYIKDGYQYVGSFPAHLWRQATNDDLYPTLSYGIRTFDQHWSSIRSQLTMPYHYVSIGPGTGEKDNIILRHLLSLEAIDTVVYVPVDISPQLLRMSFDKAMHDIDTDRVELLPVELDITELKALTGLKVVVEELGRDKGVLISLLGNTLANFRENSKTMLDKIASLLSSDADRLFIELATASEARDSLAKRAASEYRRSPSFREFALATLCDYTDIPMGRASSNLVQSLGEVDGETLHITTRFVPKEHMTIKMRNDELVRLDPGEFIELYKSRKYTPQAVEQLLADLDVIERRVATYNEAFGIGMYLLSRDEVAGQNTMTPDPIAAMPPS